MTLDDVADMIKRHEGSGYNKRRNRFEVYLDTEGVPTCGWGHALHVGSYVPLDICLKFFGHDFSTAISDAEYIQKKFGIDLDTVREGVLVDMAFQLGRSKLMEFKKMLAALCIDDFDEAAKQILDSKAAKQCPSRYKELSKMMRKGEV